MTYIPFICRIVLAFVFLAAAMGKVRHRDALVATVHELGIRDPVAPVASGLLLVSEATLGVLFAGDIFPSLAAFWALFLLVIFASASLYTLGSGRIISCNCFGETASRLGWGTLTRALLLALPVGGYYLGNRFDPSISWPTNLEILTEASGLALALILLGRWLLTVPVLLDLVLLRNRSIELYSDDAAMSPPFPRNTRRSRRNY